MTVKNERADSGQPVPAPDAVAALGEAELDAVHGGLLPAVRVAEPGTETQAGGLVKAGPGTLILNGGTSTS